MALYLPVRAISRSQKIRIGRQTATRDTTIYVDISDINTRRDVEHHQALGALLVVGALSASNVDTIVAWGADTDEGAANNDMVVRTYKGELRNRQTGAMVAVAQTDLTLTAAHATLVRIDIVQVHTTTGVVTKKDGTAAASPVAPTADASNIAIASINVPATDTAITTNQITDLRPRG